MKNVDDRYENYYNAYKNDYGAADELNEAKKKEFNYKRLNGLIKQMNTQNQMEKQNFFKGDWKSRKRH